jgi:hypothetical protein
LPPAVTGADELVSPPPLLLSLLLLPQPATASAAKPTKTAPTHAPRRNPFIAGMFLLKALLQAPA